MKCEGLRPDEMTKQERMISLVLGAPIDRVPLIPYSSMGFFARNAGYSLRTFFDEPEVAFKAQLLGMEQYQLDSTPAFGWAENVAWAFGGDFRYPTSEYQQTLLLTRCPVQSEADAWNLKLPDVKTAGLYPKYMEFSRLQEEHGMNIACFEGEPFSIATSLAGTEAFFRWMKEKPEICHHLLRLSVEHVVNLVEYWVDTFGKNRVSFRTAVGHDSDQHISTEQFEEFSFPYMKEMHERVLAAGIRPPILVHTCGAENLKVSYYREIPFGGPGLISIGELTDLRRTVEILGDEHIVMGNVDSMLIAYGTPEEVYERAGQCIEIGKTAPRGFILMTSCEMPPMTPPANVWAMRKAINDFGWYQ
jgi:uroporphyrinogen decarboxylase